MCLTMARPSPRPLRVHARRLPVLGSLTETLEHVRHERRIDAATVVGDCNFHVVPVVPERHENRAAVGRELDGVREEVPDDLLETRRIPVDAAPSGSRRVSRRIALCVRGRAHGLERQADDVGELDALVAGEAVCRR